MKYKTGNMFEIASKSDIVIATGNASIKKNGELVMGRGAALEMKTRCPWSAKVFGGMIKEVPTPYGGFPKYGVIMSSGYGIYQVKYHFKDKADLHLIQFSAFVLEDRANNFPEYNFHLNYPGIGYGGRTKEEVEPLLERLPDNVTIWEFEA